VTKTNLKQTNRLRVAIVEDDAPLRRIITGWLRQPGDLELVGEYGDAESAINALPEMGAQVVLVDINLPGLDGTECVHRLKPQMPATQFIMLTVYDDTRRIFRSLAVGASGYLLKRASAEELLAAIASVHRGESPMSGSIARKVVDSFQQPTPKEDGHTKLGPRENEILELLSQGFLYKEIAEKLEVSPFTVNAHIRSIYEKLHVHSRSQAVAKYLGIHTSPGT
jgi:DNA-binding NarL/FixJ family response regulator